MNPPFEHFTRRNITIFCASILAIPTGLVAAYIHDNPSVLGLGAEFDVVAAATSVVTCLAGIVGAIYVANKAPSDHLPSG